MRVLILHTLPPASTSSDRWEYEFDLHSAADGIVEVLPDAIVLGVKGEAGEILEAVHRTKPDVIFNLCEAPLGQPRLEPHAAALFEWMGIPFTGSGSEALALCRRKDRAKQVLSAAGVAVPGTRRFPCIVKPADEDGSAGIHADSICNDETELARALARMRGPALVEEFLPGREFSVSLWGRAHPEYASIGETIFQGGVRILTYQGKWDTECYEYKNTPLIYGEVASELHSELVAIAAAAWRATGLRGYASIDIRLNGDGEPCVLDVNPNPACNPGVRIHRAAEELGWTWEQFVQRQLEWAL